MTLAKLQSPKGWAKVDSVFFSVGFGTHLGGDYSNVPPKNLLDTWTHIPEKMPYYNWDGGGRVY